ncbi:LytR/AlgR family response regulator transcription factor [Mucilaginibacter sp. FT3.2]|uniref:LytR/AlgR family response regulator transcription factor n=1 Tax=Mucilaginibacter sp. FT3.2 TaxID=2723090 RepID=UPI00162169CC|nr:LytTR family DNA-binding domain-containing protein [Mucilaginibacter sp. FT3.2]MBB6232735.1 two-component system LytT family response regulator [Mucilaginibacter sp. FT3.2]
MRVIIADDEPAALTSLEILLNTEPQVEIVATCINGIEAVKAITLYKPDLVFLDIQMPEMDGIEVLKTLDNSHLCCYVFVTAYDKYAVEAFNRSAVDYLLKPYDDERFFKSLKKAKQIILNKRTLESSLSLQKLIALIGDTDGFQRNYVKRLVSKSNGNTIVVAVDEIKFIEAQGNFVHLHTHNHVRVGNYTFKKLLQILDPDRFIQIHKSFIVCVDFIEIIEPYFHGDYILTLKDKDKTKLKLSRNFKPSLDLILN